MSDKMTCPGCEAHSSTVLNRFRNGDPCSFCGLSAEAALEIMEVREKRADAELKARLVDALKRADKAEDQVRRLRNLLTSVIDQAQEAAKEMDNPEPWRNEW